MEDDYTFQLLSAPSGGTFGQAEVNEQLYRNRSAALQKLRGRVYAERGVIRREDIGENGRFPMYADQQSWHLLLLDRGEDVVGCARYRVHPNTAGVEQLMLWRQNWTGHTAATGEVRSAIEQELETARKQNLSYVEMGGWALLDAWRGSKAALELLLAHYVLGEFWGGALAVCLASVRSGSPSVLRRTGGSPLLSDGESLPPSVNPRYTRPLELLKFDSRSPAPRFAPLIKRLSAKLANSLIVQADASREAKGIYRSAAFGAAS